MPNYRRAHVPGGTFFFTLVTEDRTPLFNNPTARNLLHTAIADCAKRRPFVLDAIILLPDHLHVLLTLPRGDPDFSTRLSAIKASFTHSYVASGLPERPRSPSRLTHRRRGVWQRRFWEHHIRNEDDFSHHLDYLHYNPVKHGLAPCPHAWPYSTFSRFVLRNIYDPHWLCSCSSLPATPPNFFSLAGVELD